MTDEQREALLDGWEEVAAGWGRQAERFGVAVAPVSDAMLHAARLEPGVRVLELAAGPGELSRRAAALVTPTAVLCTDGVEAMVEVAREAAQDAGIDNVVCQRAQLEWIDLPAASVDVILCRYGLMFALDVEAALRECRRVLAPGGRLVAAVQAGGAENPWLELPNRAAADAGLELAAPDGPGPFRLADPSALLGRLADVGFFDTTVAEIDFAWSYADERDWIGEKVDHARGFGTHWRGLDDAARGRLRTALEQLAEPYRQADGSLRVPGRALVLASDV